ncbi:hypothetical protein NB640_04965 [Oxalobacter vibrioformis]|uniref:Uncharacterized protein n=1 Tax=Oxalobacter vibrioformis TaxID=933080 RepID=A0A9E9M1X0_9BURK|nr:hypothetical protein [Oxalobacter vibrioformis]WAW10988.1 hypothetical protein NB640_04965 [Oxalobacter vibrioformis]
MTDKNAELYKAIDHLHNELYTIQQQLCLLSDLTAREQVDGFPLTIKPASLSVTMSCFAEQIQAAMDYTAALFRFISTNRT